MRTYKHTVFAVLLYGGQRSDAGVGSGRRGRFLHW